MTYQLIVRRIQGHEPGHVLEIPWEDLPTSSLFVDAVTGGPRLWRLPSKPLGTMSISTCGLPVRTERFSRL